MQAEQQSGSHLPRANAGKDIGMRQRFRREKEQTSAAKECAGSSSAQQDPKENRIQRRQKCSANTRQCRKRPQRTVHPSGMAVVGAAHQQNPAQSQPEQQCQKSRHAPRRQTDRFAVPHAEQRRQRIGARRQRCDQCQMQGCSSVHAFVPPSENSGTRQSAQCARSLAFPVTATAPCVRCFHAATDASLYGVTRSSCSPQPDGAPCASSFGMDSSDSSRSCARSAMLCRYMDAPVPYWVRIPLPFSPDSPIQSRTDRPCCSASQRH